MRYGKFLQKGGTIGFLAPSFGCGGGDYRTVSFENALRKWREMGYSLLLGPNCYACEGVGISNTPEKCGREVMDSFLAKESDCLISCGGGELMCEVLPYVDFSKLAEAEPKWFMGYSDNTNLTYLLATLADTASVYGPCAGTFGMEPWHTSLYDAFGILTGDKACREMPGGQPHKGMEAVEGHGRQYVERGGCKVAVGGYDGWEQESLKGPGNPLAPYHLTRTRILHIYAGRERTSERLVFSGRLLGGCLDCLVNLLGTRFDRTAEFVERYKDDGIILFLEACDLNVFSIRRAMWQMEEAGWLRHVKGFLIGRPLNGAAMMNLDAYDAVLEVAGRKNVPVVMDADLGHLPPMMPLVVGSMAEVDVKGNDIRIEMCFV